MALPTAETGERWYETMRRAVSSHVPVLALTVLALVWGYSWVVVKVGLRYSQPFTFVALRNSLGAIVLFAALAATRRSLWPRAFGMALLVGLLQTTGFFALTVWALEMGGAGKVALLTYTMPFWLILMAWVFFSERPRGLQWLAVTLASAGLALILRPWQLTGVASSLLAIGGGFLWAASAVAATILHRRQSVDLLSFTAWQMLLGSLPLVLIAAFTYDRAPVWSTSFICALAFTAVCATAVAWVLWLYILRSMSPGIAGISVLAVPLIAIAMSWLQLHEQPSSGDAVGMALVVAALVVITVREVARGRHSAPPLAEPPPSE